MKQLLEKRQTQKSKKPNFMRQENSRYNRLAKNYRKPKGVHSKMRLKRKGQPVQVSTGYKSPANVRGCLANGNYPVIVCNVSELKSVSEGKCAVIASCVGKRKRLEMLEYAVKNNITLNIDNPEETIEKLKPKPKKENKQEESKENTTAKKKAIKKQDNKNDKDKAKKSLAKK